MNQSCFLEGLSALSLSATEEQLNAFSIYSTNLKEWNEKMNLTAICDDEGIAVKHFLDSILPLSQIALPEGASLLDVGTGAGFPGLPLAIMRPDLHVTLMDSLQKRIGFLDHVCQTIEREDISLIHGRAEEMGKNPAYREQFDVLVSRAVANLKVLCEYCLPFVKVGGTFIALKAQDIDQELSDAKAMIGSLGGRVDNILSVPLPQSDIVRKLIVIQKVSPTPPQFPRRANKIQGKK